MTSIVHLRLLFTFGFLIQTCNKKANNDNNDNNDNDNDNTSSNSNIM